MCPRVANDWIGVTNLPSAATRAATGGKVVADEVEAHSSSRLVGHYLIRKLKLSQRLFVHLVDPVY